MTGTLLSVAGTVGGVLAAAGLVWSALRLGRSSGLARTRLLWLVWGATVTLTIGATSAAFSALLHWPDAPLAGLAVGCAVMPLAAALARSTPAGAHVEAVLVQTLVVAGLVLLVGAVYLVVVAGLGRVPEGQERTVLGLSMAAAGIASLLAFPARRRLEEWANEHVYGERHAPDEALRTFGNRMSRAVPMDELLLQLVETLKKTMQLSAAEIWTGADGSLARSVSVPERPGTQLRLAGEELPVMARARAQGNAWLQVWVPRLLDGRSDHLVRSVAIAHLGELLGLIVVERPGDGVPFSDEEDQVLVALARQVGLALHNVRLDSALQASLDELRVRNEELIASRARVVSAADESRRQIERNLHDGAQQHLVALAVKVGLLKTLLATDPATAAGMVDDLRADVQTTLTELRELAHGIYPPLLRDRGLGEALQNAANRASLPTAVVADGVTRYDTDVEAAVYFCCLEAMQNAGKHAGKTARVTVAVGNGDGSLWFEVSDDGAGFEPGRHEQGHGFVNMRDRLGAFGGTLEVRSSPGTGTTIRGTLPVVISA